MKKSAQNKRPAKREKVPVVPGAQKQAVKADPTASDQSADFDPAKSLEQRRRAVLAEGHLEYVRTGAYAEMNRRLAELDGEAEPQEDEDSAAHRWGIPTPSAFDFACWDCEWNRKAGGENLVEGDGEAYYAGAILIDILGELGRRARKGGPRALEMICKIAELATDWTERLTKERPEQIRSITESYRAFPIMVSKHPDLSGRKYIEGKLEALNVGARGVVNHKGFDSRSTERQPFKSAIHEMVERLFHVIRTIRDDRRLALWWECPEWLNVVCRTPALSEATSRKAAEAWFDAAWHLLCEATAQRPEELPLLKDIGRYKRGSVKRDSIRKSRFANGAQRGLHDRLKEGWLARFARQN